MNKLKIDSEMVKQLDSNLLIGGEIKHVYEELTKTVNEDYLRLDLVNFFLYRK